MGAFVRNNSLTLAMFGLFAVSAVGQVVAGFRVYTDDIVEHGGRALSLAGYLTSGAFVEAVFENWESEFLQMAVFVVLTKYLRQKGSSESKKYDQEDDVDRDPRTQRTKADAPWPVRKGGVALLIYEHSLSIVLFVLFFLSFIGHAAGGARAYSEDQLLHGAPGVTLFAYLGTSQFWFESFQNWQSEFLSIGVLIYLSVYLRERGSPQSKPVAAPHAQTGE